MIAIMKHRGNDGNEMGWEFYTLNCQECIRNYNLQYFLLINQLSTCLYVHVFFLIFTVYTYRLQTCGCICCFWVFLHWLWGVCSGKICLHIKQDSERWLWIWMRPTESSWRLARRRWCRFLLLFWVMVSVGPGLYRYWMTLMMCILLNLSMFIYEGLEVFCCVPSA